MKREIIITADGSSTIHLPDWNEQYHSKHGAIQEAYHVFIKNGLIYYLNRSQNPNISILEIGFGTGLNTLITMLEAKKSDLHITYNAIEAYPVDVNEIEALNYTKQLQVENEGQVFKKIHHVSWEETHKIEAFFRLKKRQLFFSEINEKAVYNIIYYDAFGARVQPELWTEKMFKLMYNALKPKGMLVTYCAKGSVRRAMQTVGFQIERLPGPPGKREMLRATK